MELQELKAMAYDALSAIEFYQVRLREINQRISEIVAEQQKEVEAKGPEL